MKFTKKIVLSSVLALGLLSQATIGSAVGEPTGQLTVTLAGDESDGALTLLSVADLSGKINITDNNTKTAPLTKTGSIEISDTRAVANPWHLSVKVNQPTERGTGISLGANAISFNINVAGNGNTELESKNPASVLESSTEILSGQYSAVIPADVITSQLTLEDEFSSKTKGVYQNTIIYTLTEEVPANAPDEKFTVSYDSNEGSIVLPTVDVVSGSKITAPNAPTKAGNSFLGWYKEAGLTNQWDFGADTVTENITLYAKWKADAEDPNIIVNEEPAVGETISIYGIDWRILDLDMDDNAGNGHQALLLKNNVLTVKEATGSGSATDGYKPWIRDVPTGGGDSYDAYYFNAAGENGYELGGNDTAYLKGAIDYYYENQFPAEAKPYVQKVLLNNPTYDQFKDDTLFSSPNYKQWYNLGAPYAVNTNDDWRDFYKDLRFSTTLDSAGSQQAFALSIGDINVHMGLNGQADGSSLLYFANDQPVNTNNHYHLRSPGMYSNTNAIVYYNSFINTSETNLGYGNYVKNNINMVRPAIAFLLPD